MRAIIFIGAALLAAPASAQSLTAEQLAAVSPLFAAYVGGVTCDRLIDTDAATRYLDGKLGKAEVYKNDAIAYAGYFALAQMSIQATFGALPTTKAGKAKYCRDMMTAFGPTGDRIPGILKP